LFGRTALSPIYGTRIEFKIACLCLLVLLHLVLAAFRLSLLDMGLLRFAAQDDPIVTSARTHFVASREVLLIFSACLTGTSCLASYSLFINSLLRYLLGLYLSRIRKRLKLRSLFGAVYDPRAL